MDISGVKEYLRLEVDEDDRIVQSLLDSAVLFLENAGVPRQEENELYRLALRMLASHWYENREVIGKNTNLSYGLESIIHQLRLSEPNTGGSDSLANRENA